MFVLLVFHLFSDNPIYSPLVDALGPVRTARRTFEDDELIKNRDAARLIMDLSDTALVNTGYFYQHITENRVNPSTCVTDMEELLSRYGPFIHFSLACNHNI